MSRKSKTVGIVDWEQHRAQSVCDVHNLLQRNNPTDLLIPMEFPKLPWQTVATDLLVFNGKSYIIVIDYFSHYIELGVLQNITSREVIGHLKEIFSRHEIPNVVSVRSDNDNTSEKFKQFARDYGFSHVTSSPKLPQSNGEEECTVQIVTNILKKCKDPNLALLEDRAMPLSNGYSPSELLMT